MRPSPSGKVLDMASPHQSDRSHASSVRARSVLQRPPEEREGLAESIAARMDLPMTAAGAIFLLLVAAETISSPSGTIGTVFAWLGWFLWALFVAEFVLRLVVAPSAWSYFKRNWWQLVFLAVPALRFLRALQALKAVRLGRMGRVGRVLSSAVRSGRSAGRRLSSRLLTLTVVTAIVILTASQILFELGAYDDYGEALYRTTLATIGGEPLFATAGAARIVEIILVMYSVVIFATLAGSAGAFILERRDDDRARTQP